MCLVRVVCCANISEHPRDTSLPQRARSNFLPDQLPQLPLHPPERRTHSTCQRATCINLIQGGHLTTDRNTLSPSARSPPPPGGSRLGSTAPGLLSVRGRGWPVLHPRHAGRDVGIPGRRANLGRRLDEHLRRVPMRATMGQRGARAALTSATY